MAKVLKAVGGLATEIIGKGASELGEKSISASGRHISKEAIQQILGKSKKASQLFDAQPIPPQDFPAIKYLSESGDTRFADYKAAYDEGVTPVMVGITDKVNQEILERSQKAEVPRQLEELKNPRNPEEELAGLKEKYIASTNDVDHQRIIQDGLEQDEGIQQALAGIQRAKDRGSAGGEDTFKRKLRETKGTPGSYVEEQAKEFVSRREDMQGRLVKRDSYGVHRKTDPEFPGKKPLSKEDHAALKRKEGLEALIEQHHMMSAYDSSVLADQLGKLGHRFKYNAYMYILQNYKMLPGNFDLNIANIPAGPHRLKSGNLHAWLNDMGFEEYWREFAKNNPGNPDPNKMMEAIDLFFDEVFYPSLIKMDALVQQAPKKYEWKGLYIAPYLLKDAKARVKHLNEAFRPQNLKSTEGAKDVAIDQLHTMGSQAGDDLQGYRGMEVVDGQMIKAREGFGGLGVGDLTKEKAYKALNTKPKKTKTSKKK